MSNIGVIPKIQDLIEVDLISEKIMSAVSEHIH